MRKLITLSLALSLAGLTACAPTTAPASPADTPAPTKVTLMLDWVPNTNHTGFFVAQTQGYFAAAGLEVAIVQPGEVYAEQAVASGAADFGVSFQEQVTLARADGVPLVSVAALIQHNTSGFAARSGLGVTSPKDWEGLKYGSFGSPFEAPTLRLLMTCAGGDFAKLQMVETGFSDPLALLDAGQIDLAWIFYGWQGVQARQQGLALDLVMLDEWFDCIPDYYTPVLIASEATVAERPEVARAFVGAVARGYAFAIQNPEQAADLLVQAVPELDADLVRESQAWLSPRYQADAPRWGEQSAAVWQAYADWMTANGILSQPFDGSAAFTNAFLP